MCPHRNVVYAHPSSSCDLQMLQTLFASGMVLMGAKMWETDDGEGKGNVHVDQTQPAKKPPRAEEEDKDKPRAEEGKDKPRASKSGSAKRNQKQRQANAVTTQKEIVAHDETMLCAPCGEPCERWMYRARTSTLSQRRSQYRQRARSSQEWSGSTGSTAPARASSVSSACAGSRAEVWSASRNSTALK